MGLKDKIIKCATCKKEFIWQESNFRPFCSSGCKQADLGHWLFETYSIQGQSTDEEESETSSESDS